MNILLIQPYITVVDPETYLSEPLGLVCLASYLKQEFNDTVNISILDLYAANNSCKKVQDYFIIGENNVEVIGKKLDSFKPDIVGITCNFTVFYQDSVELSKIVKKFFPDVPIVFGGAHATIEAYNILLDNESVDYVVSNEGEVTFKELVNAIKNNVSVDNIQGITYRSTENKIISNFNRPLISNLDILPIPDRSFIDMKFYKKSTKNSTWYIRNNPPATIMTSRGCPYDCVFCSTKVMWQRVWRPRSLNLVFKEIEYLINDYGIKEIIIIDDQFMTNKSRVHEFCDFFISNNYDVSFFYESGFSPWLLDETLLKKMKSAGFYSIRFTIESGCLKTLQYIRKPINLNRTKDLIIKANKLGYWTWANFIIGFPNETSKDIMQTINYAYNTTLDYACFFIAKLNAGSDLYKYYVKKGLINKKLVRGSNYYISDYDTYKLTAKQLNFYLNKFSNKWFLHKLFFFLKPLNFYNYLLPKLKSKSDIIYLYKMLYNLIIKKLIIKLHKQ